MSEIEIWVIVDENGDYDIAKEQGDLEVEDSSLASRVIRISLKVPTPAPVELSAELPSELNGATLTIS